MISGNMPTIVKMGVRTIIKKVGLKNIGVPMLTILIRNNTIF